MGNKKIAPVQMFSSFGEFDSVEELNRAAAGQKAEGDFEALNALAKENGIEEWDVEDYIAGNMESLATVTSAAMGRLSVEKEFLSNEPENIKGPCMVIIQFAQALIVNEDFARAVMKKGRRAKELEKEMYHNHLISGTDMELIEIIKAYYLGGVKKEKKKIEEIKERYRG